MSSFVNKYGKRLRARFPLLYKNRYCDQEDFSIAVFGGENDNKNFILRNFDTKVYLPSLSKRTHGRKEIASGSEIFLTDQSDDWHSIISVKKYSSSTRSWKILPSPPQTVKRRYLFFYAKIVHNWCI